MASSVHISSDELSNAFHDQFSTVISLESRLQGDYSEDITGPARRRWVIKHLTEVAQAQGLSSQVLPQATALNVQTREFSPPPPAQGSTLSVHARDFLTPSPTQGRTFSRPRHIAPWYNNFNLADQGVYDSSGPYRPAPSIVSSRQPSRAPSPYNGFDPAELAAYREVVRAQLQSSNQGAQSQHYEPSERLGFNSDPFLRTTNSLPPSRLPSTPPNNLASALYPSTPPNQPTRHRRQTSPPFSVSDLAANSTLRANADLIGQFRMGSLTAPAHYRTHEVYALEVKIGDYVHSVKNAGM